MDLLWFLTKKLNKIFTSTPKPLKSGATENDESPKTAKCYANKITELNLENKNCGKHPLNINSWTFAGLC